MRIPKPKISIVIVTWNTRDMTLRLLSSLFAEGLSNDCEVILVDNNSGDGTVECVMREYPLVRVMRNSVNRGFARACNQAASIAIGRYLLLLNSDIILDVDAIRSLERALDSNPRVAIVGPKLLSADGSVQLSRYRLPSPFRAFCDHLGLTAWMPNSRIFGDYRFAPADKLQEAEYLIGACLLIRKSSFDNVKGFDESFFFYGEEADLSMRLRRKGWSILFVPETSVIHLGGGSGSSVPEQVFSEFRKAQERYIMKHYGVIGLWWFRSTLLFGSAIRCLLFSIAQLILQKPELRDKRRLWGRIFWWNIGVRHQGLENTMR